MSRMCGRITLGLSILLILGTLDRKQCSQSRLCREDFALLSSRFEDQELGDVQNIYYFSQPLPVGTIISFAPTSIKAVLPLSVYASYLLSIPNQQPIHPLSIYASYLSTISNQQILSTTAKMKFIYFILPLISLALAESQIRCPCHQQDCSKAADVSVMYSYTNCELTSFSRPVLAKIRTSSTSISAAMPTPHLPKISVSRSVEALTTGFHTVPH